MYRGLVDVLVQHVLPPEVVPLGSNEVLQTMAELGNQMPGYPGDADILGRTVIPGKFLSVTLDETVLHPEEIIPDIDAGLVAQHHNIIRIGFQI